MRKLYATVSSLFFAAISFVFLSAFSNSLNTCTQHVGICNFVQELKTEVYAIVQENTDVDRRLEEAVHKVLDFQELSKFVMGRYWKEASAEQRAVFSDRYGRYIKNVYVTQLRTFAHYRMKIMSVREQDSGEYAVRVRFINPEQKDDFVVLEFHVVGATEPKVRDIRFNNSTSVAINQRSVVDGVIKKYGIDGAISHFK
ncbi:phospholipid-binding protein MlaC [Candidatus Anaplasma sp. TIGMIC]|uniref:MlaC/ttg2D family ABC transporter substrate-binding protein n=1 Tax=Candidatus Anaplasma sp. TIGMIC TaxID=3020713 RepID=UPI00232F8CC1|nr:ABC transporter substrate-binding protein [Candidatus Anaplasma sp. TIGMIC]MDB1135784.1 ABC transporter substrate-binding protein [Candidatus Anaplasma sp. TIGMIC]